MRFDELINTDVLSAGSRGLLSAGHFRRWTVRTAVIASLVSVFGTASAGLGDLGLIDAVAVDDRTGQVGLLLLIDRPLEDGLTKRRVERKLVVYAAYVESTGFKQKYPRANTGIVSVEVRHPGKATALGGVVLEQVEGKCRELKFRCILTKYERQTPK